MSLFDHMKLHAEISKERASEGWAVVRTVQEKVWLILGDGSWKIGGVE